EFPLAMQPLSSSAPKTARSAVVGQVARDYADDHFPLLILGDDSYGDFTFKTKFKIVDGLTEQVAGIAFRIQDEKNFYYVRADAVANKLSFCGVLKGANHTLYSKDRPVQKGVWHELVVQCEGPKIHIGVDGEFLDWISDLTFSAGKIAFCTKSDSIVHFGDPSMTYTPREPFVQMIVRDMMKEYPRLQGVKIYMVPPKQKDVKLVASNNEAEIGQPGEKTDADVIDRGVNYYRRDKEMIYITMPLRDRNGDPVAAVRFVIKGFPGQTQDNAMVRVTPVLKKMQLRASAAESLF
ncbi:MAG TPA: family 16 glycoside hydrolase, partial [Verrucomicrobiae bacterium]|nr:family 16 glycoside hydrolase [Verrucomicrobiae bacterium]